MTRVRATFCIVAPVVFCASVLITAPAWAQLATAELNGRVTDSSGAVLPGVTVTATQTATGLVRTVVTDENGAYLMSNLPTGPYRLEVSLQGFSSYVQTGHRAAGRRHADDQRRPRARLARGDGHGRSRRADRRRPQRRHQRRSIENERIVELPLQGRQVTDLLVLSGAAVQTAEATNRTAPGGVQISVAGGLPTGVGYTLDGATHNNPQENVNLPLPFPDALQEFRVATSGLTAQNGVHSAAAVNAVTKSGTNRFAGNALRVPASPLGSTRRARLRRSAPTASAWTTV